MKKTIKLYIILSLLFSNIPSFAQIRKFEKEKSKIDSLDSIYENNRNDRQICTKLIYEYSQILRVIEGKNSDLEPYIYQLRGKCYFYGLNDFNGAIKDYSKTISFHNKILSCDYMRNQGVGTEWREHIYYSSFAFRAIAYFQLKKFTEGCEDLRIAIENSRLNLNEYLKYCN
jgi:tetratricopeptide (TPR) repeat protein